MTRRRRLIGCAILAVVVVVGLPLLGYVVLIEDMFGVHATGFKRGLVNSSDDPIHYPGSAALIDVYCQSAGPDGTLYVRFRISTADLKSFMSQKAFPGPWLTGKAFDRDLPWLMKWHWRDLGLVDGKDCHGWSGTLPYRRSDGIVEPWPASVVIRPEPPGTVVVYVVYNSI
jgi:hypothetical protein